MTVKELKQICKDNNYTNYSKLTKQDLIYYIRNKGIATKGLEYKINKLKQKSNEYQKEYNKKEYNKVWNYIRSMESWNITDKQKAEWSKGNYRASWGLWSETENNLLCINIDGDLFD
jgi:hypothetical protein